MLRREFVEAVVDKVKELLPTMEVDCKEIVKNNDVVLHGVVIRKSGETVAPTIYIEDFLSEESTKRIYNAMTLHIAEKIVAAYGRVRNETKNFGDITNIITDFTKVAPMLRLRLVNRINNARMFETVPYMPFLDLAIIAVIELQQNEDGVATIKVTNDLLKCWNVAALSDILPIARENMADYDYSLMSVAELIGIPMELLPVQMYILTNEYFLAHYCRYCHADNLNIFQLKLC